jgi:hypothetical protein
LIEKALLGAGILVLIGFVASFVALQFGSDPTYLLVTGAVLGLLSLRMVLIRGGSLSSVLATVLVPCWFLAGLIIPGNGMVLNVLFVLVAIGLALGERSSRRRDKNAGAVRTSTSLPEEEA